MPVHASQSALLLIGALAAAGQAQPLVWSDEFEGDALDTETWEPMIGTGTLYGLPPGWGNNELQYYTDDPSNVHVDAGALHIVAREDDQGHDYTSARIRTMGKVDLTYGRIEARIKLPSGQGIWPAFWMLPTDSPYGGWAAGGEIDVLESVNEATTVYGTIHFGGEWPDNTKNGGLVVPGVDLSEDFHVYRVEWEPTSIRWFFDGELYHVVTSEQWWSAGAPGDSLAPFDSPFHFLLNVAVGGDWPGPPDGGTEFPQEMTVDWVRVYDLSQYPFPGEAHAVPGRIEAEDFDAGYDAFLDCDEGNNGGAYRDTDVDVQVATEGAFNVGWICEGEWLEFTLDVAESGTYDVGARVASLSSEGAFHLEVDGQVVTEPIEFDPTGGWQTWETVSTSIELEQGERVLRFVNLGLPGQAYNLNWLDLQPACAADVNGDGQLTILDFIVFQGLFEEGLDEADCNDDGDLSILDFLCYQQLFVAGCD